MLKSQAQISQRAESIDLGERGYDATDEEKGKDQDANINEDSEKK